MEASVFVKFDFVVNKVADRLINEWFSFYDLCDSCTCSLTCAGRFWHLDGFRAAKSYTFWDESYCRCVLGLGYLIKKGKKI